MSPIQFVLLLVAGIAAIQALIWIPIMVRFRRRMRDAYSEVGARVAADKVLRPPEMARYRGATAPGYPAKDSNGVIALSKRRLVFRTVSGTEIDIPIAEINDVRESRAFGGSAIGSRTHLILGLPAGEVAFVVTDNPGWLAALTDVRRRKR